ncbi:hypothetical protein DY245_24335 [Streptomyces inhibens]|uniref:WXG100 family type VII secretion target n=1 Tax=Streptomyces inhibens TaxID=2293571 RepID=A0A371PZY6_STRIH|nr:hypothetical protein [Streptomyces inhibens]REK87891.1 hypothetical protein DY245_24335 [Streptomyces inhibens]
MGSYADNKYAPQDKCYAIENTTKFYKIDFTSLKAMVADAKPETVAGVAHAWEQVHNTMVVDNGGGIRAYFDKAIDEVLGHWEGDAAKAFRERAKKISESIGNGAQYAKNVSEGMGRAHEALSAYKQHLDGMEMPDWGDRAWDWATDHIDRQDKNADSQLASGKSATQVVEDNEDDLSAQKETQLKAAATMEYLGAAYRTNAAAIGKPAKIVDDSTDIPPPDNPGIPPVHYPLPGSVTKPKGMPKGSLKPMGQGPGFSSDGLKTPGIDGGIGNSMPAKGSFTPSVGTGLDSFTPPQGVGGGTGGGTGGGVGVPGGIGGGAGTGGLSGGGGIGGGVGVPGGIGAGGMAGGAKGGRTGGIPGGVPGGRAGAAGAGAGAAGRGGGRPGMPGMGGAGAAGAKGGAKGAGAGGRGGALARQKGGLIGGTAGGKGAGGSQGGSGLHRSRGGAQSGAGASGSRRPAGMPGAHGAHGAKGKDDKGQNGERPDYLVEDEETWTSERNVAPKVIE